MFDGPEENEEVTLEIGWGICPFYRNWLGWRNLLWWLNPVYYWFRVTSPSYSSWQGRYTTIDQARAVQIKWIEDHATNKAEIRAINNDAGWAMSDIK
jgi:hypothetical protein